MISSKTIQLWRASRSRCPRYSFTTSAAYREVESRKPPLLAKFQTDLKEAMKAKDKTKLNVLRGVLTETITLEKQSQGIKSDKQLFKLLEKRKNASIRAANEFKAAGREDLNVKENEQISVLQSYLDTFEVLTADETVAVIDGIVRSFFSKGAPPKKERVRLQLFHPATEDRAGGPFCEKIVDERLVTQTIDRLIAEVTTQHGALAKAGS